MTRLSWDDSGSRIFGIGVDRGVLYLQNGSGVPWNGLAAVTEAPSGGDRAENYYEGEKFFTSRRPESFEATIEAFTYPLEFNQFEGLNQFANQQKRSYFNFSYRTMLGSDTDGFDGEYLIHIIYNAMVTPSTKKYDTISADSKANLFEWPITTAPINIGGYVGSHLVIDTRVAYSWAVSALEDLLYGTATSAATLPSPEALFELFEDAAILKITDLGDGSWRAEGPDSAIQMIDATSFSITWPSAIFLDSDTFIISSL